ncbi:hypothetical protein EJ06DRAFT_528521 [Trichodelitschia bisporula]|uniref:MI domain-containing protein n=1 Tax=Trichodelitschia bisporula TaxID=703511 RepID=A0A6G1I2K4_9PEZI|nr:hypothetical protein EJ06DRAFT_528521 [Trichodelitschia bisporula]
MAIAPKLPKDLLDRIQAPSAAGTGRGKARKPLTRKEKRKAERAAKKVKTAPPPRHEAPVHKRAKTYAGLERRVQRPEPETESEDDGEEDDFAAFESEDGHEEPPAKSILKKPTKTFPAVEVAPEEAAAPRVPRAVKEALAEDDSEIAALEKRLGIKRKKGLPKAFEEDGLDDLLDGIDELVTGETNKRKRDEYEEFLEGKRKKGQAARDESEDESEGSEDEGEFGSDLGSDDFEGDFDEGEEGDESMGEGGSGGEDEDEGDYDDEDFGDSDSYKAKSKTAPKKARENPYLPPVAPTAQSAKYIPPSMRAPVASETEDLTRLRRQLQGLLNRLSEAHLLSILKEVEGIYASNPRQHVTTILIDLLMAMVSDPTSLMDTFLLLHAGFIAALYKVTGPHFGAQFLERLVTAFSTSYASESTSETPTKVSTNLIALLSSLYTFNLVSATLPFDYIRLFLSTLTPLNTELLLKLLRTCGPQLRTDDPTALRSIVTLLQTAVAAAGGAEALPVRTRFMLETIDALRNGRALKTPAHAAGPASDLTTRLKKTLGSLNARAKANEPLGVGLADLARGEKEGKWWVVGASWRNETGREKAGAQDEAAPADAAALSEPVPVAPSDVRDASAIGAGTPDLVRLAKEQRMNTDVRRGIFVSIMSASDVADAQRRIGKLRLKKAQELEVPRVVLHCAGAEAAYNAYYTLLARRLCSEHRFRMAFQFGLWDVWRRLGEGDEERGLDEDDEGLDLRKVVNLARLYGELVADGALSITVTKTLNFAYLQPKTKTFLEVMLVTALQKSQRKSKTKRDEQAVVDIFSKAREAPQVITGLQFFLQKVVKKADIAGTEEEKKTVRWACRVATDILAVLASSSAAADLV